MTEAYKKLIATLEEIFQLERFSYYTIVWDVIKNKIPELSGQIQEVLEKE